MKLLEDIIEHATVSSEPIAQTLRRCLVLAYKLKNDRLKAWVENELNGYTDATDLPPYRKGKGIALGLFHDGFSSTINNQPLSPHLMKPEHRHWASDIALRQPVAVYDDPDQKDSAFGWPPSLTALYQDKFISGMYLNRAWLPIPSSLVLGMIDTVRTRVLTFALEIQSELPEGTEQAVEQISAATVDRLVTVHIYGGNVNIGDNGQINANAIIAGDAASLKTALEGLGLANQHVAELQEAIAADGESDSIGKKTMGWIGQTATAGTKAGLKIGGEVAKEALTAYVKQFLGVP